MKSFLIFIGGFITGILALFLFTFMMNDSNEPNDGLVGLSLFAEKGDCISQDRQIEIFHVIEPNYALANIGEIPDEITILLINYDNKTYYDQQKIRIPANKCARQIGIYHYTTMVGMDKTIPAVIIE